MALVNNRIQLIMVGDCPSREELQKFTKQKGLEHRIKLLGSKDKSEVLALIKASYALILPSYHESLGIVLLEALSLGRPVIGSNVPGIDEIIINDKNGLLFEAGNTEQMARCINRIFSNGEFYEQLAKWGRKDVLNRFNWNHITNQTVEKYQKMLSP
jgi:glycosyltransferase involved in cell wall biosynthesis